MEIAWLEEALAKDVQEVAMEMARKVRVAEATKTLNLEEYGLLAALQSHILAGSATCAALLTLRAKKGVPV